MKTTNYLIKDDNFLDQLNIEALKKQPNILVQLFCGESQKKAQQIIELILEALPQAICIATSTDGEIKDEQISTHKSVLSISTFENTTLQTAYSLKDSSFENGVELATQLISSDTKLLILFTDGTHTNGENFLKGVESVQNDIMICGGMAGDNGSFTQSFLSSQNRFLNQGAVGVALNSTTLSVQNDYRFNWLPIGIEHTIEKIKDNRVYSISGMSPVAFYAKYLGEEVSKALPATGIEFPLIIEKNGFQTARAVIAKHQDGSVSFAGNLKEGDKVKLGFGNAEMLMQNPMASFTNFSSHHVESFFLYSCMARRRYMQEFIHAEVEPFANIASTAGFFTYAEFYHNKGHNQLLNQTLTVIALSESKEKHQAQQHCKLIDQPSSDYSRTIKALTNLVQQASRDYDQQTQKLNREKSYSHNLLKAQKKFLHHAVHETNTPLSIIMGNIELYEMEHGKNRYLSNIEVAMKNTYAIYEDLSYLIKQDQLQYRIVPLDLNDYVRSRVDFFSQVAQKAKSNFEYICKHKEMIIDFNETKLQRIIDNNLTNAIKYTFENATIFVELKASTYHYILTISSHSQVIQEPQKIFEEYYREEQGQEGFGLGLNLVKRLCEEEGVSIDVHSEPKQTCFTYKFKRKEKS